MERVTMFLIKIFGGMMLTGAILLGAGVVLPHSGMATSLIAIGAFAILTGFIGFLKPSNWTQRGREE